MYVVSTRTIVPFFPTISCNLILLLFLIYIVYTSYSRDSYEQKDEKYNLVAAAVFKNESHILKEWIDHSYDLVVSKKSFFSDFEVE